MGIVAVRQCSQRFGNSSRKRADIGGEHNQVHRSVPLPKCAAPFVRRARCSEQTLPLKSRLSSVWVGDARYSALGSATESAQQFGPDRRLAGSL